MIGAFDSNFLLDVLRPGRKEDTERHSGEHKRQRNQQQQNEATLDRDPETEITAGQHHPEGGREPIFRHLHRQLHE